MLSSRAFAVASLGIPLSLFLKDLSWQDLSITNIKNSAYNLMQASISHFAHLVPIVGSALVAKHYGTLHQEAMLSTIAHTENVILPLNIAYAAMKMYGVNDIAALKECAAKDGVLSKCGIFKILSEEAPLAVIAGASFNALGAMKSQDIHGALDVLKYALQHGASVGLVGIPIAILATTALKNLVYGEDYPSFSYESLWDDLVYVGRYSAKYAMYEGAMYLAMGATGGLLPALVFKAGVKLGAAFLSGGLAQGLFNPTEWDGWMPKFNGGWSEFGNQFMMGGINNIWYKTLGNSRIGMVDNYGIPIFAEALEGVFKATGAFKNFWHSDATTTVSIPQKPPTSRELPLKLNAELENAQAKCNMHYHPFYLPNVCKIGDDQLDSSNLDQTHDQLPITLLPVIDSSDVH